MRIILLVLLVSVAAHLRCQEVGGCVCHFADNYNPNATFNDGTCDYDLQHLLEIGYGLGDLLGCGAPVEEMIGLIGAGGFIVDIDLESGEVLLAWPRQNNGIAYAEYDGSFGYCGLQDISNGRIASSLKTYMFDMTQFGEDITDGKGNFKRIQEAYSRTTTSPNTGFCGRYWNSNMMGCTDWFIPTEAALLMYKNVCYEKYAGSQYSASMRTDPYSNSNSSASYSACGGLYPFGDRWLWTSEPANLTNEWSNADLSMKIVNLGSVSTTTHGTSTRSHSSTGDVFPMGIGRIESVGSIPNCADWQYGNSPNYSAYGQFNVPCNYPFFNCGTTDHPWWDQMVRGIYPGHTTKIFMDDESIRPLMLNIPGQINLDGVNYTVNNFQIDSITGLPPGLILSYVAGDLIDSDATVCMEWIGDPTLKGDYNITLYGTYFVETSGVLFAFPEFQPFTHDIRIAERSYYSSSATEGCTYNQAQNFDPLATIDDGSCAFTELCQGDFNGDELIGVQDILYLLGLYNTPCE
jgi:hypothetical protein